MKPFIAWLALIAIILSCSISYAHVPIDASGNDDFANSMFISDPEKSWAIYGHLGAEKAQYYSFDMEEGGSINLSLLRSADPGERDFRPGMALIGPGIECTGRLPKHVTLPENLQNSCIQAVWGSDSIDATYEPFGPSSYVELAEINLSAPKTARYYSVVYSNDTAGHYSLAVGTKEEFSYWERVSMPVRLISVYLWEGQSLGMILIPYMVAEIIGLLIFWRGSRRTPFRLAGTLAGFLFLATSSTVFIQGVYSLTRAPLGPEVYVTLAVIVFHVILGVASIRLARGEAGILQRTILTIIGTIALLGGSGLILGPIMAFVAGFLPSSVESDS